MNPPPELRFGRGMFFFFFFLEASVINRGVKADEFDMNNPLVRRAKVGILRE